MVEATAGFDSRVVSAYLRSGDWTVERSDDRRSIFRHATGQQVFIPAHRGSDFQELMGLALGEIASAEDKDNEELIIDLAWRHFDKLHLQRDAASSALRMAETIDLHRALSDVIVASARAAAEPRSSYSGRRPTTVESYVDQVRIVPARPGSFVVRALLPLDNPPEQSDLGLEGLVRSHVRSVTSTMLRATEAAVRTARDIADGAPVNRWNDVVGMGVSANLCDALARLPGNLDEERADVHLRVAWTWTAPAQPVRPVTVPAGLAPLLAYGSDYLREDSQEHTIRLTGLVTKLHREAATGPGEITVRGHVENWDSSSRALRFRLDEQSYRLAIAAHEEGVSVRVVATVLRSVQGLEVMRVIDLQRFDEVPSG